MTVPVTYASGQPETDPHRLGHTGNGSKSGDATGRGGKGPAPPRVVVSYGFWIFMLSDIIMFAAIFATYAVLVGANNGGPTGAELFDPARTAIETGVLLVSSFTCGMASIATEQRNMFWTQVFLLLTGLLGFAFLTLEIQEFASMVADGAGPQRSAFLSAFFTLVGCHGLHITVGLLWLGTMMAQLWAKGFRTDIRHRLLCFSLFWHALDIIWIAIFTIVYLMVPG